MSDAETETREEIGADAAATETSPAGVAAAEGEPHRRHRRVPLRTHRLRTGVVTGVIVLVAVSLPFLILEASHTVANSKAGRAVSPSGPAAAELPDTPAALLVVVGPDHEAAGLVALARDGSGKGGTAVVVPTGMQVGGSAGTPSSRLGDAYATGGLDGERQAVESALGITTSSAAEVDEAGLAALLGASAPVTVNLADRAVDTGANGKEVVLYPAGPVQLTAAEVAHLLVAKGPNESETARLPRTAAIWNAVLNHSSGGSLGASSSSAAPSSGPTTAVPRTARTSASARPTRTSAGRAATSSRVAAPTTAATSIPPTTSLSTAAFASQLATVQAGSAKAQVLSARPVLDAVDNPNGVDLLAVDIPAMRLLLAETMPGAVSPANDNIRLRLINNSGDPSLLAPAAQRLVDAGANLIIVSPATTTAAQTVVEYQDAAGRPAASTFQPVVGASVVRLGTDRIDGIDATIILGSDFAGFLQTEQAKNTNTTSSSNRSSTSNATGSTNP
jgi:hypothetical protein